MSLSALVPVVWLFLLSPLAAKGESEMVMGTWTPRQVPGTDSCTCSPTDYTFTLNLNGKCDDSNVVPSDAIGRVRCIVSDDQFQPIDDDIPTVITQIDVLEFGLNLTLLSETSFPGRFNDGDMFDFTSITGTPNYDGTNVPQIFQLSLNGLNANGEMVRNNLGVVYTNACGVEPIFNEGDDLGWLIFTAFSDPIAEFCQAQPTAAPVSGPPSSTPDLTETCSCSPREITFRFDFEGDCPGNIEPDEAIERVGCVIDNDFQDQVMDYTPTRVTKVSIEEVTATGSIMKFDISNEVFQTGDTFTYASASEDGFLIPTSLQIVLEGENDISVGVFNVVLFEYTNECGAEVVFPDGAAVGWLVVDEYTPGREETCQARTDGPTESPTELPATAEPTDIPTEALSIATPSPTDAPTASPTDTPTLEPTSIPTESPSIAAVVDTTPSPTRVPTKSPTFTPTQVLTTDPTSNPTAVPPTPANGARPTQMQMTPMPTRQQTTDPPTATPPTTSNVVPTHMQMTPMPTPQKTTRPSTTNGGVTPTQMSMPPQPTPPPMDDPNMSFDINRFLQLVYKEQEDVFLSSPIKKPEESNNIRRRLVPLAKDG